MIDKYGRRIACGTIDDCVYEEDAKYCRYCKSGVCQADQPIPEPKKEPPVPYSEMHKYWIHGGKLYLRNRYRGL